MDDKTSDEIRNLISFDRKPDNETNSDENPENNIDDIYDENTDLPTDDKTEGESENNTDNTAYENTEDSADNENKETDRIEISDDSRYSDADKLIRLVVSNSEKAAKAVKVRAKSHRNVPKTAKKSNRKTGRKKGSILGKRTKRAGQSFLIREEGSDFVVLNIPFLNFLNHEGEEEYYPELKADYRPPKKKKKKSRRPKRALRKRRLLRTYPKVRNTQKLPLFRRMRIFPRTMTTRGLLRLRIMTAIPTVNIPRLSRSMRTIYKKAI